MTTSETPSSTRNELIREAYRLGEVKLGAQVQLAISADQRATVLAGIYVAAATGVFAAMAASERLMSTRAFAVGSGATAIAFLAAAGLCVGAILPTDVWVPGNEPSEWEKDIREGRDYSSALSDQAKHFDDQIKANNTILIKNARFFRWGAVLGVVAPLIGIFAAGVTCLSVLA